MIADQHERNAGRGQVVSLSDLVLVVPLYYIFFQLRFFCVCLKSKKLLVLHFLAHLLSSSAVLYCCKKLVFQRQIIASLERSEEWTGACRFNHKW